MNSEAKLALLKDRFNRLSGSPKNIKCPGVVHKLKRQIRNFS